MCRTLPLLIWLTDCRPAFYFPGQRCRAVFYFDLRHHRSPMIANMMDTTPASPHIFMVLTLIKRRSGSRDCLLGQTARRRRAYVAGLYRPPQHPDPILLVILVAAFFYKDYASLFRNNKQLIKALSPSNSIVASWSVFASTAGEFAAGTHWRGCPSQSINAER